MTQELAMCLLSRKILPLQTVVKVLAARPVEEQGQEWASHPLLAVSVAQQERTEILK